MQYNVNTPKEYREILDEDWRKEVLLKIRDYILQNTKIKESIEYKMLCFSLNESPVFYLNAQKSFVGFYIAENSKINEHKESILNNFNVGKGCIRIKKKNSKELQSIYNFIEKCI